MEAVAQRLPRRPWSGRQPRAAAAARAVCSPTRRSAALDRRGLRPCSPAADVAELAVIAAGRRAAPRRSRCCWRATAAPTARCSAGADPRNRWTCCASCSTARSAVLPRLRARRWPGARDAGASSTWPSRWAKSTTAQLEGLARYGVWRFCFGDGRSTPASCVAEGARRSAPHGPAAAHRRRRAGAPRLPARGRATYPLFRWRATATQLLRKTSEFVARALRDLHARRRASWLRDACAQLDTAPAAGAPAGRAPTCAATCGRVALARRRPARRAEADQRRPVVARLPLRRATERCRPDRDGLHRLVPPRDRLWADPFPMQGTGATTSSSRSCRSPRGKAHISVVEVRRDGSASDAGEGAGARLPPVLSVPGRGGAASST